MSETPTDETKRIETKRVPRPLLRWLAFGLGPNEAFTAWLAIFTGVLSVETAVSAWVLWKTDSTLHGTLIARNRAWITPTIELVPSSIGQDRPLEIRIKYTNYGNEPANRVSISNTLKLLPVKFDNAWLNSGSALDVKGCGGDIGPPYRMLPHNEDFPLTLSTNKLTKEEFADFKSGAKTFYLSGCVRYRTLAEDVWTRYCRYFTNEDGSGVTLAAHSEDRLLPTELCPEGNAAN